MPQLDLGTLLLVAAGFGLALSLAVLAGVVTARLFFHAAEVEDHRP